MQKVWRIELLGTLRANREGHSITRFRTRRVASLLAYLAYFRQSVHSRDEVAELLWPDLDGAASRRNLRQALLSLRSSLEPAPFASGSVVLAIHDGIQLNTDTLSTDVAEFEERIALSRRADTTARTLELLRQAVSLYKGDLLPGFGDEWVWSHRLRLEDMYLSALRKLSAESEPSEAIDHLRLGVIREPFNEHWHTELIRRYLEIGEPQRGLNQYNEMKRALHDSFGQSPSQESRELADKARRALSVGDSDELSHPIADAPKPTPERRIGLPIFANRYFGREREILQIRSLLESGQSRLVTILGPAGVGKTRLSVQCAWAISESQPWNVWFVPVADKLKASELYEAIIAAIDARHGGSSAEVRRISELIGDRKTLLVLDNLEQIADEAGAFLAPLLDQIPNIVCLVSTRQPMLIRHEQVVAIEPLPLPGTEGADLLALASNPTIQLFLDRCQSIRPDLQLNERNSSAIVDLCTRLDGLPLAIEIVARLSNSFSPTQMVKHLPSKTTGLTSRGKDVPARHKSLRAAIDWSYDSLSDGLKELFSRVSVFRGGFTLNAAARVCLAVGGDQTELNEACLTALQSLQERSLVRSEPSEDARTPRFTMLTAFREYAEERMAVRDLNELRNRHAEFFLSQTPPDRPFANIEEQTLQHLAIELDYENYTAAIEFSLEQGNLERCAKLLGILSTRWLARGPKANERSLIKQIADRPETNLLTAKLRVQVQRMLGTTYIRSGEYQAAYDAVTRAVQIAEKEGDAHLLATCFSGLSICAGYLGRLEESLSLNKRVLELIGTEDLVLCERSHLGIGSVYWNLGRIEEASSAFEKARSISERLRGGEPDALIVINQARVALDTGRIGEALRLAYEAIRISKRLQDDFTLAVALTVVSRYHWVNRNFEAATATNLEALEKCKQGDFLFWILQCLRNQALIWTAMGQFGNAATLLAATAESGSTGRKFDRNDDDDAIAAIREGLSSSEFESAWAKGLAMDRGQAIQFVSIQS